MLAPEIRAMLELDEELNGSVAELPLTRRRLLIRDVLDERVRRTGVPLDQVAAVADVVIPGAGGQIAARVFTPAGEGPHPAFLHIHGGGFMLGSIHLLLNDAKCAHICRGAGCVVVTIEYRLAPEFPFPAGPEDCYAALLWLVEHAHELGVDPARIGVGGESAGGNLAAVVALMARDRQGPPLALQLLEVPVTDLSDGRDRHPSLAQFAEGYGLDRSAMEEFRSAYLPDPAAGRDPYASPLLAEDLSGVAPAHILTAELDVLRDSGEAFARRLQEAGVRTTMQRFRGHTHGSSSLWQTWQPARVWMEEVVSGVREALLAGVPAA